MKNLPRISLIALGLVLVVFSLASVTFSLPVLFIGDVSEFQPNIPNGGRANTIAVHPDYASKIYVASESGGLFRSLDGGEHWRHVDELPCSDLMSVAYLNPEIVLVTALDDFKRPGGGGVWRSTDGGYGWTQISITSIPPGITTGPLSAYDISIVPGSGEIYVGSQYGVLKSTDQGETWAFQDVYGSGDRRVISIVALDRDHVLAGGEAQGLRRTEDGGATWVRPDTPIVDVRDIHALSRSPLSSRQAFVVHNERFGDTYVPTFHYTENSGRTWTFVFGTPAGSGNAGGLFFAKVVLCSEGFFRDPQPCLFFSDRLHLSTARILTNFTGRISGFDRWRTLWTDHDDIRDLAFDNASPPNPLLLATDGGLHKYHDGWIPYWTFTGGGRNGYNALQTTEVQGQLVEDILRYDLYFGTWDNSLWASGDDGETWPNSVGAEGMFIEAEKRIPTASVYRKINLVACADCRNIITQNLFTHAASWRNPPTTNYGPAVRIAPSMHIQGVNTSGSFSAGMAVTYDFGSRWQQYAVFGETLRQIPKLGRTGRLVHSTEIYAAYRASFDRSGLIEVVKLLRLSQAPSSPAASVIRPYMRNFGGLGINVRDVAPYAIDPGNYWHIIAPDVINNKMMETVDGGDNWHEIPGLTDLVTDHGRFRFSKGMSPLVTALSFSPQNPDMVILGTVEGGLYISTDNGHSWAGIADSRRVTHPTGFAWKNAGDVIVSTWGRGLWRLRGRLVEITDDFLHPCRSGLCDVSPWPGMSGGERLRFDGSLQVYEGRIMGASINNGVLKEVFVSNGSSVVFGTENKQDPGIKVTETNKVVGFNGVGTLPQGPQRTSIMTGVVFDRENRLKGAIFANKPLMMYQPKEIVEQERNLNTKSPTEGKPYVRVTARNNVIGSVAEPGETILVTSPNLARNTDITIYIDNRPAAKARTNAQGDLGAQVRAPAEFGRHTIVIRYSNDEQNVIDGAMFRVRPRDDMEAGKGRRAPAVQRHGAR
jgi:hypothetical protein